jgi:purine catabolism regulator
VALPTLAEVLALPVVKAGLPKVLTPRCSLERPVRWVHVSELADIGVLLQGGELILTTGIALPATEHELVQYVHQLADAGASGLLIEMGRRFTSIPQFLIDACHRGDLPLIVLHREVEFVRLTEAIHARIVHDQFEALRLSERAHKTFTQLCLEGADTTDIVRTASRMVGEPVVFEDLMHRVLAFDPAGGTVDELLRNWEKRSRRVAGDSATSATNHHFGWVVAGVESRGERFGRLIMVTTTEASAEQIMVLERAATAITMTRLLELNRETVERQALRSTLNDIIEQRYTDESSMHARTEAIGVPTANRSLLALVVTVAPTDPDRRIRRSGWERVADGVRRSAVPALVAPVGEGRVGILATLVNEDDKRRVLDLLAHHIHEGEQTDTVIGVGSLAHRLDDVARAFAEAEQVAAASHALGASKPYYEMPDTQLRGFLYTLVDDARLQSYVERTLGALLLYDDRNGTDLLGALRSFLTHGGNKKAAATAAQVSRQSLYERLATIERILHIDLDAPETRTSLHVALIATELRKPGI